MKESILKTDSRIIFKETFGSEDLVRANGGLPTGVTFSNGNGSFLLSSASRIFYNKIFSGTGSVRIKCKPTSFATLQLLFDFRDNTASPSGAHGYLNATTGQIVYAAGGTIYNRGIPSTTSYLNSDNDIVITGISLSNLRFAIGSNYATLFNFTGSIELFEIYKGTLTANEVKNLYENRQNRELQNSNGSVYKEILRVDARNGVISNKYTGSTTGTELLTNGTFDSGVITGWSNGIVAPSSYSITNGILTMTRNTNNCFLNQNALVVGKTYRTIVRYRVVSGSPNFEVWNGGTTGRSPVLTSTTWTEYVHTAVCATSTNSYIYLGNNGVVEIDWIKCEEVIPSVTPTAVSVVRSGNVYAMDFNGTTSKIDCGSYDTLTGNKTFIAWVNPRGYGEGNLGRIFSNGGPSVGVDATMQLYLYSSSKSFYFRSSVSSYAESAAAYDFNKWTMVTVTRTSTGITNIYVNGALSGTANQTSGTPTAPTTNITIGNDATGVSTFNGGLSNLRIYDGILSTQEIAQLWQDEKSLYNL